jgi:hypothetical protein
LEVKKNILSEEAILKGKNLVGLSTNEIENEIALKNTDENSEPTK